MADLTIDISHLQRGQAGNYEPHVYEACLTFSAEHSHELPRADRVKRIASVLVHSFTENAPSGTQDDYYKPRLKRCEELSSSKTESVWLVRVECPYTD